ncbi:MAG: DUF5615 family PIN-like protein [Promethearchaeota archaeon]
MRFKIDENLPFIFKKLIEDVGDHQVESIFHEKLTGIDDFSLNKICLKERRILLTLDTDFINIQEQYYGIIIFRPKTQGKNAVKKLFTQFLERFPLEEVRGKKIIIEPNFIRIRF